MKIHNRLKYDHKFINEYIYHTNLELYPKSNSNYISICWIYLHRIVYENYLK